MSHKQERKKENYLGFFLLLAALMVFAVIVKSCNIAGYQAKQAIENPGTHEIDQRR